MIEDFKDISGYEGLYQVSNLGRIKSLKCGKEKILKLKKDTHGYLQIGLYKDKKYKNFMVHKLVAKTFLNNHNNLPQVNHKDENKENCNVENLEYCTQIYNIQYSQARKVNQYDLSGNYMKTWDCISEVSRQLKINKSCIIQCCKGKQKTAGKYIWKYK